MKKIITLLVVINLLTINLKIKAQTSRVIDLNWLQVAISANKNKYENKKLKILFDTLVKNKVNIADYLTPQRNEDTRGDTLKAKFIKIYFNRGLLSVGVLHGESYFAHPQRLDTLNTHVPFIFITFKQPVNFMNTWKDADRKGLGAVRWNAKLRSFWGRFVVDKIEVGEY
jgi:hypothetical protein